MKKDRVVCTGASASKKIALYYYRDSREAAGGIHGSRANGRNAVLRQRRL